MVGADVIDWDSDASHVLLNPRMPEEERRQLETYVVPLPGHVWLATSGTTGALKLAALAKSAILASAGAVNRHLGATAADVWCCVLPTFHVGGVGIYARAFLTGSRVVAADWNPAAFSAMQEVTLASLVPAQVRDLVTRGLSPPRALRAIVVGGGALDDDLLRRGCDLGWPLLPSYGMTEACSQIATARPGSADLILLDHLEARTEADGTIAIRGEALLTGYGTADGFRDPKRDGWFVTEDLGTIRDGVVRVTGRRGEFLKIGGESVDLRRLDAILESVAGSHAAVVAVPDTRLGHVVHLVVEEGALSGAIAAAYDARVHPFERARRVHRVPKIPRTALGKLMRSDLVALIGGDLE